MFQLADQREDDKDPPPSNPSVANKAYPGLVLVPPSDRTILRRRLLRGALALVAVLWTVWTFTTRPPASDSNAPCQSEAGQLSTGTSPEDCGPASSATEIGPHPSGTSLTQVSQGTAQAEAPPVLSVPRAEPEQPQTKPMKEPHASTHAELPEPRTELQAGNPDHEKSAGNRPTEKPVVNPESDTYLAEQGDPFAQYRLGRRFAKQEGRQAPESVSWYRKASTGLHRLAESGNGQAMYVLGVMYAYGRGVEKDISQARRWLTRAVEQKVTAAQPVLANLPLSTRSSSNTQIHATEQTKPRKQPN